MQTLCNAESLWEADKKPGPALDPGQRPRLAFQWAVDRMRTSDGKRTAVTVGGMSGPEKVKMLREHAAEAGVASCPFADTLERRLTEE
jgi:hypothetical protein